MNPVDRGLWQDRSFWGHISTQFLGAFNDNLFKQLILLLAISEVAGKNLPANGQQEVDIQSIAMVIFAVPFILLAGIAGYLSERFSKRNIFVWSKIAEILVMLLGVLAFVALNREALQDATARQLIETLIPLFLILFLMGAQSSFFGPAKLGMMVLCIDPSLGRRSEPAADANSSSDDDRPGSSASSSSSLSSPPLGFLNHLEALFQRIAQDSPDGRLASERRYQNRLRTPENGIEIPTALLEEIRSLAVDGVVRAPASSAL